MQKTTKKTLLTSGQKMFGNESLYNAVAQKPRGKRTEAQKGEYGSVWSRQAPGEYKAS